MVIGAISQCCSLNGDMLFAYEKCVCYQRKVTWSDLRTGPRKVCTLTTHIIIISIILLLFFIVIIFSLITSMHSS